jgi:hypothetical protein
MTARRAGTCSERRLARAQPPGARQPCRVKSGGTLAAARVAPGGQPRRARPRPRPHAAVPRGGTRERAARRSCRAHTVARTQRGALFQARQPSGQRQPRDAPGGQGATHPPRRTGRATPGASSAAPGSCRACPGTWCRPWPAGPTGPGCPARGRGASAARRGRAGRRSRRRARLGADGARSASEHARGACGAASGAQARARAPQSRGAAAGLHRAAACVARSRRCAEYGGRLVSDDVTMTSHPCASPGRFARALRSAAACAAAPRAVRSATRHSSARPRGKFEPERRRGTTCRCGAVRPLLGSARALACLTGASGSIERLARCSRVQGV